jgi:hypothetical protein
MYLVLKTLQVTVAIGVLFVMNIWLDGYHLYGAQVLYSAFKGTYNETHAFPLVSLCDVEKRDLGETKNYKMQCLLSMNLFNEKIFVLFWFFLVYVAIVTIINALSWFSRVLAQHKRYNYVRWLISISKSASLDMENNEDDKLMMKTFVQEFLQPDGVFTFRLINANTTTVVMHEILGKLWVLYKEDEQKARLSRVEDAPAKNI